MDKEKIDTSLLEYLRKMLNNHDLSYKDHPKRLTGGYETQIYSFQLEGAPENLSQPLVVRIIPGSKRGHPKSRQGTVMKYLAEKGFPAPSVYFDCFDPSILGGNFIVMDFVPGKTLYEYKKDVPRIMAETHLDLHRIDSRPLRKRLLSAGWEESSFTGLSWRESYIHDNYLDWLKPALKWIKENKPETIHAICHGDFHPLNILIDKGKVTGVLDWSSNRIEDPCYDIATTIIDLSLLAPIIAPQFGDVLNEKVSDEYLDYYQEENFVDQAKLEYYQAFKCLMTMVEHEISVNVWHTPGILEAVIDRFKVITGIEPIPA